jgi:hypothetical protein
MILVGGSKMAKSPYTPVPVIVPAAYGLACVDKSILIEYYGYPRTVWLLVVPFFSLWVVFSCALSQLNYEALPVITKLIDLGLLTTNIPQLRFPEPMIMQSVGHHPIRYLISESQSNFSNLIGHQSESLGQAVIEYQRRYNIPPPSRFPAWHTFAQMHNVKLIHELDIIHQQMTPFWGIEPWVIRQRVKEALGFKENNLLAVLIRDGNISFVQGGNSTEVDWMKKSMVGMIKGFVKYLPDMDLAFNLHDEPRIAVPNDQLNRLVHKALFEAMPKANSSYNSRNSFNQPKRNFGPSKAIEDV